MSNPDFLTRVLHRIALTPIPLWVRVLATGWTVVLIPVYWQHYGPTNFLWFSDLALFGGVISLWMPNRLIPSMMSVAVLLLETAWNVSFFYELLTGHNLLQLTAYMFDEERPLFLRGLSLFHVWVPALLVWMVVRWGYSRRALAAQTLLASIVLPVTYWLTEPPASENWVHGPGGTNPWFEQPWYLLSWMVLLPIAVYVPSHLLLAWLDRRTERAVPNPRSPHLDRPLAARRAVGDSTT